jgi:hypothetical protein
MPRAGLTWMQIAERIPGRIGKQCRERWTNHLDPNLKKGGWTHEEDTILAEAQQRWGNAWTKIAKLLPGRAENAVKNRWNSAFRRKKSAMFGKGPPQDEDTATIARARTQMEAIDRDEREPSDKQRSSKRAVASSSSIPAPSRTTRSSSAPQAKTRTRVKTAADASAALDRSNSMPAGQDSPSTMLDLFGARRGVPFLRLAPYPAFAYSREYRAPLRLAAMACGWGRQRPHAVDETIPESAVRPRLIEDPSQMKGGGALDFDGDALLALDDDDAEDALKTDDGDALDVSFDALDMNMDAPLKGPNGTPLSDMDGFSPAKNGISELFSSGRTGLTPSGPIGKTPVGGYGVNPGGLSPLHAHYKALSTQNPGVAVPMSDDLALQLPGTARPEDDFYDPQLRRGRCEFVSPNGQEYHAAWGLPAPRVQLPHKVSALLSSCASPQARRRQVSESPPEASA